MNDDQPTPRISLEGVQNEDTAGFSKADWIKYAAYLKRELAAERRRADELKECCDKLEFRKMQLSAAYEQAEQAAQVAETALKQTAAYKFDKDLKAAEQRATDAHDLALEDAAVTMWNFLMDYCKTMKIHPGENNQLFRGCQEIRSLISHPERVQEILADAERWRKHLRKPYRGSLVPVASGPHELEACFLMARYQIAAHCWNPSTQQRKGASDE